MSTQQQTRAEKHWRAARKASQHGQWSEAARELEHAVRLVPANAGAWHDLAVSRRALSRLPEASAAAQRACELMPADLTACKTLVDCLARQARFDEAVDAARALAPPTEPDHELLLAHATALFSARRPAEAVPVFLQALSLNLVSPLAHFRMGLAFKDLHRDHDANLCFQAALATDTAGQWRALILSTLIYGSRQECDWAQLDAHSSALLGMIDGADATVGEQVLPFTLLAMDATPAQQLRVGRLSALEMSKGIQPLPAPGARRPGRVRVGYLSSDFFNHATALLVTELLERRDSSRFETFLYSHSQDDGSEVQRRVRAAGDHFVDVKTMSDLDVARRMRADGIDIVVDLKGHTRDNRFHLLAYRPAPVQVAYLGYPGSTGAPFIDYLVGDRVVTPLDHAANYSEKIAQLPHSYQPNDRQRCLPERPSRADEGLPEDAVVLCCFNQTYKISPQMLDLWARILHGAPNTVLWMLTWTQTGYVALANELKARHVDLDRVLFAPKVSVDQHIARLRCADLFLDTWPCNAHTTASEALWAGVPVLTVPGATYASRVAASLVSACGQPEMVCADAEAYVQTAIRLATSPAELRAAQAHLDTQRMSLPLFDTERYTRDYEALLLRMFERQQAGLKPDHLAAIAAEPVPVPAAALAVPAPVPAPAPAPVAAAVAAAEVVDHAAPTASQVHLVIMQPTGYVHSLGFLDQARYLRHQLRRLGAEVTVAKNRVRTDAINIVFGAHLGFPPEWKQRHACLFFNLEQLGRGGASVAPAYMQLLRQSAVIDYDAANISAYRSGPGDVPVVPFLHAPYLHRSDVLPLEQRPIDLLFFGSLNARRIALIKRIEATGVKVTSFEHPLYGEERDQVIRQAKAVLNCHFYDSSRLEQVRVSHCLSLGTPVVCERGPHAKPHAAFEDAVTWVADGQWDSFFRKRFAKAEWFDAARTQLNRFTRHDPTEAYAEMLAHAQGVQQAHQRTADTGPWRPTQLNLGSGKDYKAGWLNLDIIDRAEPDLVLDLGQAVELPLTRTLRHGGRLELAAGQLERIYANNVLEHVPDLPMLMGNALTLLKTGGEFEIEVPYEKAPTAWQDPTHLRAMNENSWLYYTDWFWYLGWFEARFEVAQSTWLDLQLAPCQKETAAFMKMTLRKVPTTPRERTLARAMQADLRLPDDDDGAGVVAHGLQAPAAPAEVAVAAAAAVPAPAPQPAPAAPPIPAPAAAAGALALLRRKLPAPVAG
jgi:predicted O-linked N-acetylglucosamine transferase (SPINDLY family)/SAM-dependent methyltransferase